MPFQPKHLKPCPWKPNCVCSAGKPEDALHYIEPLTVAGGAETALQAVRAATLAQPGVTLKSEADGYLHFVRKTPVMRFRDDLEFEYDGDAGVMHVRAAARLGIRDFGNNRKLVEAIRSALGG